MKHFFSGLMVLILLNATDMKSQHFAWMGGSTGTGAAGDYGTLGVPSGTNTPGARMGPADWQDASGNFWLFGGNGLDDFGNNGYLNDLWRYNPTNQQWTWIKGDNLIAQIGVYGTPSVSAASNKPGGRTETAQWRDNQGNIWIFGGYGHDGLSSLGLLNDLWKYDPLLNQWTWMKGSNTTNGSAVYGTLNVSSISNTPGPRKGAATFHDNAGNLYLFGGIGTGSNSTYGSLNDLWRYTISTNSWTWIIGSNVVNQNGSYGTLNTASVSNSPGSRSNTSSWKDAAGNFWMFGGDGYDAQIPTKSFLNDLWQYDLTTNLWVWKGGTTVLTSPGVYGTPAVPSTSNTPGARQSAYTWVDAVDNFWLLGGAGVSNGTLAGQLNDLWKYNKNTSEWVWLKGTSLVNQPGTYGSVTVPTFNNRPGGRSSGATWMDANSNLWLFGGSGFGTGSSSSVDLVSDVWRYTNCFISPITMTIIAKDSVICAGESTSLTVNGGTNYLWSVNSVTINNIAISPNVTTTYSVGTTNANGCTYYASFTEIVDACQNINSIAAADAFAVYPLPAQNSLTFKFGEAYAGMEIIIRDLQGSIIQTDILNLSPSTIRIDFAKGLYFYEVRDRNRTLKSGKLIKE